MSTISRGEYLTSRAWHIPLVPTDGNRRAADGRHEQPPSPAGWKIETRLQKDCVFHVLASARRGDELVEANGQWEQDALDNLQSLLEHMDERDR